MKDRTFNLAIATFPYGGNGGVSNEYPGVGDFKSQVIQKAKADPRIEEIHSEPFSDTPIPMTRNGSVLWARQIGADFLLMIDSDMQPDSELREDPEAKPFWDTSLDFCLEHYDQGPNVVCAPYCGPPPIENVYVFYWGPNSHDCPNDRGRIEQYSREHASILRGIQPVAAQPTGLILFDMRAFELTDPIHHYRKLRQEGRSHHEAMKLTDPWFYYEYEDIYQSQKCSTEDVTATRDISFAGWVQHGRETIYCNWDAWAAHMKPKAVRKPRPLDAMSMHGKYRELVERNQTGTRKLHYIGAGEKPPERPRLEEQPIAHVLSEQIALCEDGLLRAKIHRAKDHDLEAISNLVAEVQPALAVEVGSLVGESALAICRSLPTHGRLICVDHFLGSPSDESGRFAARAGSDSIKEAFLKNTESYRNVGQLELWEKSDREARKDFVFGQNSVSTDGEYPLPKIDFLYLDADHEYDFVKRQIKEWAKCMSPEGIIAGHDFEIGFPGVERAVREMFTEFSVIEGSAVWYAHVKDLKTNPHSNGKTCATHA